MTATISSALSVLFILIASATSDPRRLPKIYNAVITSSENLEPSRAYPIVQPVFRPAAVAYQVQLPYIPTTAELALYPPFASHHLANYATPDNQLHVRQQQQISMLNTYPANIGSGNQVKIQPNVGPSNLESQTYPISIGAAGLIRPQQNLQENPAPLQEQGIAQTPLTTYPSNAGTPIQENAPAQQISLTPHLSSIATPITQAGSNTAHPQTAPGQQNYPPNIGLAQQGSLATYPSNIGTAYPGTPVAQTAPAQQSSLTYPPNAPVAQTAPVQHSSYPSNIGPLATYPSLGHQNIGQRSLTGYPPAQQNLAQPSNIPPTIEAQVAGRGAQNAEANIGPMPIEGDILNNNYKHRNPGIPDVPPPPLPTTRRRAPAEEPNVQNANQ